MPILFFTEEIDFYLKDEGLVKAWLGNIIKAKSFDLGDINYIFVNEEKMTWWG